MNFGEPSNGTSPGKLCFTILNENESELKNIDNENPRSKLIPFRCIEIETGTLKEFGGTRPKRYGALSHVWYGEEHPEVTWEKLKETSISELLGYLDELNKTAGELYNALEELVSDGSAAEWRLSTKVEKLFGIIEKKFMIQFRKTKAEGKIEKKVVQNLLQKITKEIKIQKSVQKVAKALKAAADLGLEYLWVDTCCMNKSNSTELMESIACMGDWYANADVCLVYLADTSVTSFTDLISQGPTSEVPKPLEWSTRGWTLQEIAMCKRAEFYNREWVKLERHGCSEREIYEICNVPRELYCTGGAWIDLPAAYVMHYAGTRKTTRGEDQAYSLMGILGVKMPILYGEGEEVAISRLIDEVIRSKGDVSVFNWTGIDSGSKRLGKSMYPIRLGAFSECSPKPVTSMVPFTMSNAGVNTIFEILPIYPVFETLNYPRGLAGLLEEVGKHYPDIDCEVPCKGMLLWDTWERLDSFKIRCPLRILKREAEYIRKADRPRLENEDPGTLPGTWVLARTLGSEKENWFLCLLELATGWGYVGWRIPSEEFQIKERIIHPDHKIQMCVR